MFGLFGGNKKSSLEKKYKALLQEARDLQRKGDITGFAKKTEEADKIADEIQKLEN